MGRREFISARSARPPLHGRNRKQLGAWYTPDELVAILIDRTLTTTWLAERSRGGARPITILDPACGDGRLLAAATERISAMGHRVAVTGVDVDPAAIDTSRERLAGDAHLICTDALEHDWAGSRFDLVLGNPPFRSQMAASTSRGGSSRFGGGPYADTAAEFLYLMTQLASGDGGRVAIVLPQSLLASRDAGSIRAGVDRCCDHLWSWWSPELLFDADVVVCAMGLERHTDDPSTGEPAGHEGADQRAAPTWADLVTRTLELPHWVDLSRNGTIADRAGLNANFRDEYYGLVPAVSDDGDGPPLITSGLIDPGVCLWGSRPVRFAKRRFEAPRVDLGRLDDKMQRWAQRKLVPKVLVATQTRIVEAVADPGGRWLPGVPVTTVTPHRVTSDAVTSDAVTPDAVSAIAAVLTSPVASLHVWSRAAGTGMSASSVRISPALIGSIPWPTGDLSAATAALGHGDLLGCGRAVTAAFGIEADHPMIEWWWDLAARRQR